MIQRPRFLAVLGVFMALSVVAVYVGPRSDVVPQTLPEGFSDTEFWRLIEDFSESDGYFRSDNFVSNEKTFQYVIPALARKAKPGGIYLGVGPDQNFTYIAALRPKLAFITDIRRQNMMLHLMYKALFETSANREEFLSRLFSRRIPHDLPKNASPEDLFERFNASPYDPQLHETTLQGILDHLRSRHQFPLSINDTDSIKYVYNAFASTGPQIRYSFPNQFANRRRFPSYSDLMQETDEEGESHSYMASEEHFQLVKKLQSENRIVPIVGDFAGDKALRSVARFLKNHGASVTAFYTSNVEFYLFQSDDWKRFMNNIAAMPVAHDSVFIRAYFNTYGPFFPNQPPDARSMTLVDSMPELISDFEAGRIKEYFDVVRRSVP